MEAADGAAADPKAECDAAADKDDSDDENKNEPDTCASADEASKLLASFMPPSAEIEADECTPYSSSSSPSA